MTKNSNIFSFLCIARKANATCFGSNAVDRAAYLNKALLIIASEDAAQNTKDRAMRIAERCKIPYICILSKAELGQIAGKKDITICAVTKKSFADQLVKLYKDSKNLTGGEHV